MNMTEGWIFWALLSALFAFAFLGERPTGQDWLGITLVTSGVLALTLK